MAKVKEVTTIVEDVVTFMVDPKVEFVSLVKHGANRTPFKVLKSETKEESNMNKVVQSVLVRNDIPNDVLAKALEGIDTRSRKEFSSFTAYPQVGISKVDKESLIVQKHDEVDGIYFVLGDLAESENEQGTLMVDVKEAVDYATLDNLYSELYAMADVVGGAMRQENADGSFRKTTILTAIDNFRSFAEVVLENISAEKLQKGVNPEDHPNLPVNLLNAIANAAVEDTTAGEGEGEGEGKADGEVKTEDVKTDGEGDSTTTPIEDDPFNRVVTSFNEALNSFGEKLIGAISEIGKEVKASSTEVKNTVAKLQENLEEVQNTVVSSKSELDEEITEKGDKDIFKGTLFQLKV